MNGPLPYVRRHIAFLLSLLGVYVLIYLDLLLVAYENKPQTFNSSKEISLNVTHINHKLEDTDTGPVVELLRHVLSNVCQTPT